MKALFLALCLIGAPVFAGSISPSTQEVSKSTSIPVELVAQNAAVATESSAVVAPAPAPAPVALPADQVSTSDFFAQALQTIKDFGGMSWVLKIAAIFTIILSSMKVSFLNDLVWSKLGQFKAWAAPGFALIVGILDLAVQHQLTVPGVLAFVSAGVGAVALHELLDTLKAVPGLGPVWVELIDVIAGFLGGPKSADQSAPQAKA